MLVALSQWVTVFYLSKWSWIISHSFFFPQLCHYDASALPEVFFYALFFLWKMFFTPTVSIDGADPVKLLLHFPTWSASSNLFSSGSVTLLIFWQTWQTLVRMSMSTHLPVSIESTVTQPLRDECPLLCHVPSHETLHCEIPGLFPCISDTTSAMVSSATAFATFIRALLWHW